MGAGLSLGRIIQQQFHAEERKNSLHRDIFFFLHDGRWEMAASCVFVEKAFES